MKKNASTTETVIAIVITLLLMCSCVWMFPDDHNRVPFEIPATEISFTEIPTFTSTPTLTSTSTTTMPTSTIDLTDTPMPNNIEGLGVPSNGADCPEGYPIKGNVRQRNPNKGEKIYHIPGDNGYGLTKPELCFSTVDQAKQAGYRSVIK